MCDGRIWRHRRPQKRATRLEMSGVLSTSRRARPGQPAQGARAATGSWRCSNTSRARIRSKVPRPTGSTSSRGPAKTSRPCTSRAKAENLGAASTPWTSHPCSRAARSCQPAAQPTSSIRPGPPCNRVTLSARSASPSSAPGVRSLRDVVGDLPVVGLGRRGVVGPDLGRGRVGPGVDGRAHRWHSTIDQLGTGGSAPSAKAARSPSRSGKAAQKRAVQPAEAPHNGQASSGIGAPIGVAAHWNRLA